MMHVYKEECYERHANISEKCSRLSLVVKIQNIWQQNAAFNQSETSITGNWIINQNSIPKTLDILSGPILNQLSSDFQIWFWRSYSVHIRAWPWGPALRQRRDMPLPEVRSHFEGAGCWGCKAVLGLYCAGHLLCVAPSDRLLHPPIQDQCWEVDSWKTWWRELLSRLSCSGRARLRKPKQRGFVPSNRNIAMFPYTGQKPGLNLKSQYVNAQLLHAFIRK